MKITIDNLDGKGAIDHSAALYGSKPLELTRHLNEPSRCVFSLNCSGGLSRPGRGGRVVVEAETGLLLFTGYVISEPALKYAGMSIEGETWTITVEAISDDYVLDKQAVPQTAGSSNQTAARLVKAITDRVDATRIAIDTLDLAAPVGFYRPDAAESWSKNVGRVAAFTRSAYRVVAGRLVMAPIGANSITLSHTAGSLRMGALQAVQTRELANDVTLCGEREPAAYVTEIFQGDGTTVLFDLSRTPLSISSTRGQLVNDNFDGPALNQRLWQINDPGSRISLSAAGLSVSGGNGADGQTALVSIDQFEIGGSMRAEVAGVALQPGTEGYLCGLYNGTVQVANCLTGFHVKQTAAGLIAIPIVEGVETGSSTLLITGRSYNFRIRLFCKELQRVGESFRCADDTGTKVYGGELFAAGAAVVAEVQDCTAGAVSAPVTLYDGFVANAPAVAWFVPVNSLSLIGSVSSARLTRSGTAWVTSESAGGNSFARRLGTAAEGADCRLESTGKLRFYPTSIPAAGELIRVSYRVPGRAVARLCSPASIASEAANGLPGTARWVGSVRSPQARSSVDCENAAAAILDMGSSRSAAWSGRYEDVNLQLSGDVWPGDLIDLTWAGMSANVVVRKVRVVASAAVPELLTYSIDFANDWASDLALKLSDSVPEDAWLPQAASAAPQALVNLPQLAVTAVSTTQLSISAGASAPACGGFEVRRRDWVFGRGNGGDLVLRSPVPNFTIPREHPVERYYIRMYDGSTPPNYSRFSSAVFVNVPMG